MKPTEVVPDTVIDAFAHRNGMGGPHADPKKFQEELRMLRWNMDHYFIEIDSLFGPIYLGVELDGYMHT